MRLLAGCRIVRAERGRQHCSTYNMFRWGGGRHSWDGPICLRSKRIVISSLISSCDNYPANNRRRRNRNAQVTPMQTSSWQHVGLSMHGLCTVAQVYTRWLREEIATMELGSSVIHPPLPGSEFSALSSHASHEKTRLELRLWSCSRIIMTSHISSSFCVSLTLYLSLSVCLSVYLSVSVSVSVSFYYLSVHVSIWVSICLCLSQSVCLSLSVSVCLSLSVCLALNLDLSIDKCMHDACMQHAITNALSNSLYRLNH